MKAKFLLFSSIFLLSVSAFSQTDGETPTTQIPVEEKKDAEKENTTSDSPFNKPIELPDFKPEKGEEEKLSLNVTGGSKKLDYKRKEGFSMNKKSTLINPGVLFEDRFAEKSKQIDKEENSLGFSERNQDLGVFESKTANVSVRFMDFGQVDGDIVRILHNNSVIIPRVTLTGKMKGFELKLEEGANRIDVHALNEGAVGPNTAYIVVYDSNGNVLASSAWNLSTNYIATLTIMKAKEVDFLALDKKKDN